MPTGRFVVETLRQAAGEGRLTLEELDQRLEGAHAARTYAELEKLTDDLPAALLPRPAGDSLPAQRFGGEPTSRFGIAVPEDAEVHARGLGIMGIFSGRHTTGPGQSGAPVIIVTGLTIMGEISVRRRAPTKEEE